MKDPGLAGLDGICIDGRSIHREVPKSRILKCSLNPSVACVVSIHLRVFVVNQVVFDQDSDPNREAPFEHRDQYFSGT
jgi:hypothetical protein